MGKPLTIGGFSGFLAVDFLAPDEPYTAFDYVELSVDPIDIEVPVPQPTTALLLGVGLIGLGLRLRPRLAG